MAEPKGKRLEQGNTVMFGIECQLVAAAPEERACCGLKTGMMSCEFEGWQREMLRQGAGPP